MKPKHIQQFLTKAKDVPFLALFALSPDSINKEKRTVEIIWTTGARVFRGDHHMELSLEPGHVRMGRLRNGAPVLDNHDMPGGICGGPGRGLHGRSEGQIGVVEDASHGLNEGNAKLRFSKRKAVQDIWLDIEDRIIRNISVGFFIHDVEQIGEDENEIPIFRAIDWEPFELSPVQAGADDKAKIRSGGNGEDSTLTGNRNIDDLINQTVKRLGNEIRKVDNPKIEDNTNINQEPEVPKSEERTMTPEELKAQEEAKKTADLKLKEDARLAEKKRSSDIKAAVRMAGFEDKYAEELIEEDVSIDVARERVIGKMAEKQKEDTTRSQIEVGDNISLDHVKRGLQNAWLVRGCRVPGRYSLDEDGKELQGLSIVEGAREFLNSMGHSVRRLTKQEVIHRALATSDFPLLLEDTMNKSLKDSFAEFPITWTPFVSFNEVDDFKQISATKFGDAPALEEVKEHGAVKLGKIGEDAEKYSVKTYAKKLRLTRKAMINDDLNAFIRIPAKFGIAARSLESDLVWALITANGGLGEDMSDGKAIHHADHLNIGTGGVISVATIGELLKLLRTQKGLDGARITLSGSWLVGPVALETVARQFLQQTTPAKDSDTNPFKSQLQWLSEPRLDDQSEIRYYLTADTGQVDMLEMAHLTGSGKQPIIVTKELGGVAGVEVEAIHDVGVKAIEHRGFTTNAGV